MAVEVGKEIQTKGIDKLFNRVIAEKFPNFENKYPGGGNIEHQTVRTKKEP
jgi:hypothetical protein